MRNKIEQYIVEHNFTGLKKWSFILISAIVFSIGVIYGYLKTVVKEVAS